MARLMRRKTRLKGGERESRTPGLRSDTHLLQIGFLFLFSFANFRLRLPLIIVLGFFGFHAREAGDVPSLGLGSFSRVEFSCLRYVLLGGRFLSSAARGVWRLLLRWVCRCFCLREALLRYDAYPVA